MGGKGTQCVDCDVDQPNQSIVSQDSPGLVGDATDLGDGAKSRSEEDPLDASTFSPPIPREAIKYLEVPSIVIEFCDRCRWQHRATWVQTELFLTFPSAHDPSLAPSKASGGASIKSITLIPRTSPDTGGRFRVWLLDSSEVAIHLLWDRKIKGGFPELKELKQLIRDKIAPTQSLGHSDKK
ncbi:hypothetical protein IE53DRAFT_336946 [Violaceomyces palustris]|uniref:Uncharacterized protein n=1 Tax=Violaceomyces palustris TaxID=1673888 RepID=A0ACD0P8T7_9BASI|nr:hypothetical protein IE53DRAFT_336946 [Violaceomyces palustris]